MAKLQIDVDGVDKTLTDIKRDLHRGMEKAAQRIADNAKADARSRIKEKDAIFNTEVYAGFKRTEVVSGPSRVRYKLYNDVDHAEPLEKGAEYGDEGPPVVALLPWVVRKMNWKAASRDTSFESNKNYIPDSWNDPDDPDSGSGSDSKSDGTEQHTRDKATGRTNVSRPIQRGDIVEVEFEADNADTITEKVINIPTEQSLELANGEWINIDAGDARKTVKRVEIVGQFDSTQKTEGDRILSKYGVEGEIIEIRDDGATLEMDDQVGTYNQEVTLSDLKTDYEIVDDKEVMEQELADDEDLEAGLTLNSQVNDLLIDGGDISSLEEGFQKDISLHLNEHLFENNLAKPGSIGVKRFDTLKEAFDDDEYTITIPENLFEYSHYQQAYYSEYIAGNEDELMNTGSNSQVEYVINHQIGRELFDNLSKDGLYEFRKYWGIRDSDDDGVWEVPDNTEFISEYSTNSELEFFAEVFAGSQYDWHNRNKRDFMEKVRDRDPTIFTDSFIDRDGDLPEYTVGHRYSNADLEIVTEDDLLNEGRENFTTNFNPNHYHIEDTDKDAFWDNSSFRKHTEYVFTSDRFEGAKSLTYKRRDGTGQFWERDNDFHLEDLTLQAVPENDTIFNNLNDDSELIVKEINEIGDYTDNNKYIRMKHLDEKTIHSDNLAEGEDVFTGENYELHPESIIGTREDNPDLWADEVELAGEFSDDALDDVLTQTFDEANIDRSYVKSSLSREPYHIVIKDKSTGDKFRVNRETRSNDAEFRSIHPDEDGNHKEWSYDYDNLENNEISIDRLNDNVVDYYNLELEEDILVDPIQFNADSKFTDSKYRATVKGFNSEDPVVVPFGQNTNEGEQFGIDAFVDKREDIEGWDSYLFDTGDKVTIDTRSGKATGRVDSTENGKSYEAENLRLMTEDGETHSFSTTDIVSFERNTGYMDDLESYDSTFDSTSAWEKYDDDISLDDFKPRHFDPLEGKYDLWAGTEIRWKRGGKSHREEIRSKITDDDGSLRFYLGQDTGNEIYAEDITDFDGAGSKLILLSEGDTVSTGDDFGEIIEKTDTGIKVEYNSGFVDLLDADQVVPVDTGELPIGTKVLMMDKHTGEDNIVGYVREHGIESESGKIYNNRSLYNLHQADVYAYKL